ncbi:MAG: bifunctional SulP family inorganic anion transporter/carbonic anhydrase [Pirellulaceae bacterium]
MASSNSLTDRSGPSLISDMSAGLVVFLVALPLCLGVALASNAPLFSGILSGIVGGLLVGAISKSQTSVSGPAAGLTAVVAAQIAALGSFQTFLMAVMIAGALQIVLGVVRAGAIADFVPSSVIKGLLAAIGLILILKQIPHLVGHDVNPLGTMSFEELDHENTFSELAHVFRFFHPGAAVIGVISIVILLAWDKVKWLKQSLIPAPLIVVLGGVGASLLLARLGGRWTVGDTHLVQVPVADSLESFLGFLQWPDPADLANPQVFMAAVTIALVASLETLLNLEAVDKLDPQKRISPPNRELIAQGVGNMTAGLIGGLPVTSVIVRSSVNINAGAKSKAATIFHGLLLLLCVALLPMWLNQIPLSALAAVLITTGLKLASPKIFRQMWREGPNQSLPFFVTVGAILLSDLLIGILIGLGFSIVFILRSNLRRPLRQIVEKHIGGEVLHIELAQQVSFLNRVAISKALASVPRGGQVLIDARDTDYIDADVLDLIIEYQEEIAPVRGIRVSLIGFREHYQQLEDQVRYVDYSTRELQASVIPDQVVQILRDGNDRFCTGQPLTRDLNRRRAATANSRHPLAIVLSGASSRTPVEMIFDMGLGDIFCTRVTGNLVSVGVLGSLEYACVVAGAKLIVVLGHGNSIVMRMAVEAFLSQQSVADTTGCTHLDPIVAEIQKSIDPRRFANWESLSHEEQQARLEELYRTHILRVIRRIGQESRALKLLIQAGRLKVVGGMYDVCTGCVDIFESADPAVKDPVATAVRG